MLQHNKDNSGLKTERRKHWRDRRAAPERRIPERMQHTDYECRSGVPRRQSDIADALPEGEVWWEEDLNYL